MRSCPVPALLALVVGLASLTAQAPPAPAPATTSAPVASAAAPAGGEAEPRPFVRFEERADGGQLELLVATYRRDDATVTLHAALHVADAEHYQEMQQRFEAFDALLYELIADADVRPHPGMAGDDGWLTLLQSELGRGLQLVAQMHHVDYRRPNFVHADLTDAELDEAFAAAGTSLLGEMMSVDTNVEPDRDAEARLRPVDLVAAFRSGRGAHELRVMGARLLASPEGQPDEPRVLIEGRNERCLAVLAEQLAVGKRRLGVYYGAAHMAHLERRLVQDLGWQRTGEEWIRAWDCRASRFPVVEKGAQQKRYRARQDVDALTDALRPWLAAHAGEVPTWPALRAASPEGKLPGRADGVDPWGREYVLRAAGRKVTVVSGGRDGMVGNDDDVAGTPVRADAPPPSGAEEPGPREPEPDVPPVPDAAPRLPGWFGHLQRQLDYRERLRVARAGFEQQHRELEEQLRVLETERSRLLRVEDELHQLSAEVRRLRPLEIEPTPASTSPLVEHRAALSATRARAVLAAATRRERELGRIPTLAELGEVGQSRDAWDNTFRLARVGEVLAVRSDGADRKAGTADDVVETAQPVTVSR